MTLIEQLEAAREGSEALDSEIGRFLEPEADWVDLFEEGVWLKRDPEDSVAFSRAPRYTTSVDAAFTLIPENWWLADLSGVPLKNEWWVTLEQSCKPFGTVDGRCNEYVGCPTPALAICIAALKIR